MRDLADPAARESMLAFSVEKILKLASLYEIFCVPDCAVELLEYCKDHLAPHVDTELLLDALTPPLRGRRMTYREYVKAVTDDPGILFPKTD
jgi:hypothetical protein